MENGQFQTAILERLERIERIVKLLAEGKFADIRSEVRDRYLTTDARQRMWELMDGTRSYADIAKQVGLSGEGVRVFVQELLEYPRPIVELEMRGRSQHPRRLL